MTEQEIINCIKIIRSDRKTVEINVCADGRLIGRIPRAMTYEDVFAFVKKNRERIERAMYRAAEHRKCAPPTPEKMTPAVLRELTERAKRVIPPRVSYYAELVGVEYGKITIRHQRTRWGSCTAEGNLNFNCLLLLTPPEVLDSVVVHELCHRKYMNHSANFYSELIRVFPGYADARKWLKQHGEELISSLPEE